MLWQLHGSIKEKGPPTAGHVATSMMHAQVSLFRETLHKHSRGVNDKQFSAVNQGGRDAGGGSQGEGLQEEGPQGKLPQGKGAQGEGGQQEGDFYSAEAVSYLDSCLKLVQAELELHILLIHSPL